MEELHLPDNIKVHFAAAENMGQFNALKTIGVRYFLYTAYPFIERKLFDKPKCPIIAPKEWKSFPEQYIPSYILHNSKHVIQDSGLFTLMFGSQKGKKDETLLNKWYDALVEFTLDNAPKATCVEVDCQKVLGVEKAWEFRLRMKRDLPNNRIINVFHLEDGQKGLDRLIEFAEYIAISVPELRFAGKKNHTYQVARYIKNKKPGIDIHLLGCTELSLLDKCKFCTSADSTSYTQSLRFGFLKGHHAKSIKTDKIIELVGLGKYNEIRKWYNETNANSIILNIYHLMHTYQKHAGDQNYYKP